jgi:hypothetical protein
VVPHKTRRLHVVLGVVTNSALVAGYAALVEHLDAVA